MKTPYMRRYRINAPSTLQIDHSIDRRLVLAPRDLSTEDGPSVTAYFLDDGPVISQKVQKLTLSPIRADGPPDYIPAA
jgi:hypothetical protein